MQGIFNFKSLFIYFVIPNLSQIYFCIQEIFKTNVSNRVLSTKSPFKLMFLSCEFTKVILESKHWREIFVLKLSDPQIIFFL